MITLTRIDERLIHGQVAFAWTLAYKSQAIMVIDDEAVSDLTQKELLEFACPVGMMCFVVNKETAVELLKKYAIKKIFIVVKSPDPLLYLVENGIELNTVNVGGLYFKDGRRQLSKTVYVDEHMVDIFKKLDSHGVILEIRTTPSDASQNLVKII